MANGLLVSFAGSTLHLDSDHPGLTHALATHFEHCLGRQGDVIADYRVTTAAADAFSIARGDKTFPDLDLESTLAFLMQDGLVQLNGASHSHLIFHAAALALQERGVLLLGRSGTGKSTLAAALISAGFHYLSDEVIAWPAADDGPVSGFCRSITLKRGSSFVWDRWQGEATVAGLLRFKDGGAWIAPTALAPAAVRASVAPSLLLFMRYAPAQPLRDEPLSSADALFRLLERLVNARNFSDGGMQAAARLARRAPAFSLTYSDSESACTWIRAKISAL